MWLANSGRMALPIGSLNHGIFDLDLGIDEKVLRSLLVLAQINVLDLAVLLLASNALQNALIGNDNSVTGGVIGASTLFIANYAFVRLTFRHAKIRRILEGRPRVLLRNGKLDRHAMDREAITQEELEDQLLDKGMTSFDGVGLILLETNGKLVFLNREQAKRLRPEMLAEA